MDTKYTRTIFARLTPEQYSQAERVAQVTGHTVSDLVRFLVTHVEPTPEYGFRLRPVAVDAQGRGE